MTGTGVPQHIEQFLSQRFGELTSEPEERPRLRDEAAHGLMADQVREIELLLGAPDSLPSDVVGLLRDDSLALLGPDEAFEVWGAEVDRTGNSVTISLEALRAAGLLGLRSGREVVVWDVNEGRIYGASADTRPRHDLDDLSARLCSLDSLLGPVLDELPGLDSEARAVLALALMRPASNAPAALRSWAANYNAACASLGEWACAHPAVVVQRSEALVARLTDVTDGLRELLDRVSGEEDVEYEQLVLAARVWVEAAAWAVAATAAGNDDVRSALGDSRSALADVAEELLLVTPIPPSPLSQFIETAAATYHDEWVGGLAAIHPSPRFRAARQPPMH